MKKIYILFFVFFSIIFLNNTSFALETYETYTSSNGTCGPYTSIDYYDNGDADLYGESDDMGFSINNVFYGVRYSGNDTIELITHTGAVFSSVGVSGGFFTDFCNTKVYGKIKVENKDVVFFQIGTRQTTSPFAIRRFILMAGDFGLKLLYSESWYNTMDWATHKTDAFDFYGKYVRLQSGVIYDMTTGDTATPGYTWTTQNINTYKYIYYIVKGGTTQFISYGSDNKFYLSTYILDGTTILKNKKEIFRNAFVGVGLERLNLDSVYKTLIRKAKVNVFTYANGDQYVWLSVCKGGSGFSSGDLIGLYNAGLTGQTEPSPNGFFLTHTGAFLDSIYLDGSVLRSLKTLDNNLLIDYGGQCSNNYGFSDFVDGKPTKIYVFKGKKMYVNFLNSTDQGLISGQSGVIGDEPSFSGSSFTGSGSFSDSDITTDIWDLDRDGDGSISVMEYTLAPFTIAQNIIKKLIQSLKDLWTFLKSIMEIGNIGFIPNTYAESSPIAESISSGTTNFMRGENERVESISDIVNVIKWAGMLLIILVILLIFFAVAYNNNSN